MSQCTAPVLASLNDKLINIRIFAVYSPVRWLLYRLFEACLLLEGN